MRSVLFTLTALALTGCSWFERDNEPKPSRGADFAALQVKYEKYLELTSETFDKDGWIMTEKCDALLHSSMLATTGVISMETLLKGRDADGRWWRRPSRDCLSTGSSKSSISRDMLLGLMHPIMVNKDYDVAKKLVDYANDNKWTMGEHDGSIDGRNRVLLTPGLFNLMADLQDWTASSGDAMPRREGDDVPEGVTPGTEYDEETPSESREFELSKVRFTDHLDALSNEIRGTIYGGLTDGELASIKKDRDNDPNNALYHALYSKYTDGNQKKAVDILLREDLFPSDRLPTSADRCNEYIWMHGEKPKDWNPCDKGETHPGHDLLFVARIILEKIEE